MQNPVAYIAYGVREAIRFFLPLKYPNIYMKAGFFQKLSLTSKSSFLWTDGQFLLNRQAGKFQVKLFFVFDYFVEVYFDEYQKQIEKMALL